MLCLIVVAILNLALQGCKLYCFLTSAWVSPVNDGITRLEDGGGGRREVCMCDVYMYVCLEGRG